MFGERGYGRNEEEKEKNTVVLYLSSVAVLLYSHNGELTGQERKYGKSCGTSVTVILFENTFRQHFYLSYLLSYLKEHLSNSLVTFVTHKRFAVLFFLPSCCANSLTLAAACTNSRATRSLSFTDQLKTFNLHILRCCFTESSKQAKHTQTEAVLSGII